MVIYSLQAFFLGLGMENNTPMQSYRLDNVFLTKMGHLRPLFRLFLSFQTNFTIFTTNKCEKCPSSIRCWDSNPRPSEYESPPITTRPGLPPNRFDNVKCSFSLSKGQMQYLRSQLVSIRLIYMASPLGNKESEKQTDFIQKYHNLFLRNSQKVNSIQSYNSG